MMNRSTFNQTSLMLFVIFTLNITKVFSQQIEITFNVSSFAGGYNVSCHGATDGSIDATVVNGVAPYTFLWSTGATTQNISGIPSGTYTFTVTDNAGHQKSKTKTLIQSATLQATLSPSHFQGGFNISKYAGTDGGIGTNVSGGAPPYRYLWSNGDTLSSVANLVAGSYTVTIKDANQCSVQKSATLTQPTALQISSLSSTLHHGYNVSCNGGSDGNTILAVTGGVPPYRYQWNNGSFNQNLSTLAAGTYSVSVRDTNNASINGQITLTQPAVISTAFTPSLYPDGYNVSCYQCFNGSITTSVTGGITPYSYSWGSGQTTANLSILGGGTYQLTVTDGNGCLNQNSTLLTEPASVDWALTGNSGVNTSSRYIGTNDTSSVAFRTNNSEAMRISGNGNIGINNNNPQAKLDVNGQVKVSTLGYSSSSSNEIHLIGAQPNGEIKGLNIVGFNPNNPVSTCINPSLGWFNSTCTGANPMDIFKEPLEGNIGIGTDAPQAKVDIVSDGSTSSTSAFRVKNLNGTSLMDLNDDGSLIFSGTINGAHSSTGSLFINGNTSSKNGGTIELYGPSQSGAESNVHIIGNAIRFFDYNSSNQQWEENVSFNSDGKVGIGTSLPSAKLHIASGNNAPGATALKVATSDGSSLLTVQNNGQVGIDWDFSDVNHQVSDYMLAVNGKIICSGERVQLTTAWPDYVFEKSHQLMQLKTFEKYIYLNKHLPGMPTAEQVSKEGIDLGEMNRLLVEKVEELSLYIIDLQKQIDELK
ncbi:MAG: SprB repeat-containing protein [Chitinophagales bacterium]